MVLRIEDTDQKRWVAGAEEYIKEALDWAGIQVDEGPEQGGEYGPYRQSDRKEHYQRYAQQLVDEGKAYYAFDTAEELSAMRERLTAAKVSNLTYNAITRVQMRNSLTLSPEEVKALIEEGTPYVIRLKVPRKEEIRLNDMVRDWVVVHSSAIDDKVLMKADGMPTYHLANVVDDYLMKITHVIRGEEWLPSAPLHVLLYKFLGWEEQMPHFAHLPLLLKPDGNGKLSKRDGDKHGFPVFPIQGEFPDKEGNRELFNGFREAGYLPDAFTNFLAFLGWNPGTEEEIFDMQKLIDSFSIDRVSKAGAKFDITKANWYNQQYLKNRSNDGLAAHLSEILEDKALTMGPGQLEKVCALMKERVTFPIEIWSKGQYFFEAPSDYDKKVVKKKWTEEAVMVLDSLKEKLKNEKELTAESAKSTLDIALEEKGVGLGKVMQAIRLAITGVGGGPDLMEIMSIIGPEKLVQRIQQAIDTLPLKQTQ